MVSEVKALAQGWRVGVLFGNGLRNRFTWPKAGEKLGAECYDVSMLEVRRSSLIPEKNNCGKNIADRNLTVEFGTLMAIFPLSRICTGGGDVRSGEVILRI